MDAFDRIAARTPKETRQFVSKMLDVADRIHEILEARKMSQKDLARAMGKSESEISKWLTGTHNLELKTISRIEEVLGEDILAVPKPQKHAVTIAIPQHRFYGGSFSVRIRPQVEEMDWHDVTSFLVHQLVEHKPQTNSILICRMTPEHTFGLGIGQKSNMEQLQKRVKELFNHIRQQSTASPDGELTIFEINQ